MPTFSLRTASRLLLGLAPFAGGLFAAPTTTHAEATIHPASSSSTLFAPLLADPLEPRVAIQSYLDERSVQLDIGHSSDIYRSDDGQFAAGVDFGTWSRLRRSNDFKFPVDAIDYLFGINASWKTPWGEEDALFNEFSGRIRLSHISAHFEDGHFNAETGTWSTQPEWNGTTPFTFSREFLELTMALSAPDKRVYAGFQYLYHTLPEGITPASWHAGMEWATSDKTWLAADWKLLPVWQTATARSEGLRGTWNLQAGMRLHNIGLDKVRLTCNYYSGISRHGMYFYRAESYATAGVMIDF